MYDSLETDKTARAVLYEAWGVYVSEAVRLPLDHNMSLEYDCTHHQASLP